MLTQDNGQRDIYSDLLNQIVRADHPYRKVLEIYEGIFNFADKITPYRGLQKVSFHQVLDALTQNLKRLLRIIENPAWQHLKLV